MKISWLAGLLVCLLAVPVLARIGGGNIKITDKVIFSHDWHVTEMGITCTKCHPRLFITPAKRKSVAATLQNCLTCHPKKW